MSGAGRGKDSSRLRSYGLLINSNFVGSVDIRKALLLIKFLIETIPAKFTLPTFRSTFLKRNIVDVGTVDLGKAPSMV